MKLAKLYTIIVGAAFIFAVGYTFITHTLQNGFDLESFHKLFHVLLGFWATFIIFRKTGQERAFVWFNVVLWGVFAVVGWLSPDLLGLAAFNRADTILHTIVAGTGIIALVADGR